MIPPSSHPTYGFKPRLQPRANGRSSSFGSVQPRRIQDQVHFGKGQAEGDPVLFQQHGPSWVTKENPVSGNNCQICSVKNMLHYFGYSEKTIENILERGVSPFLLKPDPDNPKAQQGLFPSVDENDRVIPNQYEVNHDILRKFLSEQLGMQIEEGLMIGGYHDGWSKVQELEDLEKTAFISSLNQPLLINTDDGVPGMVGMAAAAKTGHAFFAYPSKDRNNWLVVDSLVHTIQKFSNDDFDKYLFEGLKKRKVIFPIKQGPDAQKVAQYNQHEVSDAAASVKAPSESVEEPKPVEESSEVSEITIPIETPAEAVEESKPVEESPEVPKIASPIKAPSETAETPKPSSVQEAKTEADSKQSKRSLTQRLGQWFKDTWNSFTQNLKRFGNWIKSVLSSKKKAD